MTDIYLPNGDYSFPCVPADYKPHSLPRYASIPFVSALRFPATRKELKGALNRIPNFDPAQRLLDRPTRRLLLKALGELFLGVDHVADLAETTWGNILEGYVGREPHTPEFNARLRALYEAQKVGEFCAMGMNRNSAHLSGALIGTPAVGKSKGLDRVADLFPPVIHHPQFDIFQIPVLNIEMAYNGMSQGTLAHAIIDAIAKRFPPGGYRHTYLRMRANSEQLLLAAFALMHIHAVGALFVDEAQNRDYDAEIDGDPNEVVRTKAFRTSQTPLITLLITASNRMQVPLLMSGTAELRDAMGKRLSKLRRMVGEGLRPWGPLSLVPRSGATHCEYDIFMNMLWTFIYLQDPPAYTPAMRSIFHYYSFGLPGFIIALFKAVQWRALRDGIETFDLELVHSVANEELAAITRVTRKMRKVRTDPRARADLSLVTDIAAEFGLSPTSDDFQKAQQSLEEAREEAKEPPQEYSSTFTASHKSAPKAEPATGSRGKEVPTVPTADWKQVGQ